MSLVYRSAVASLAAQVALGGVAAVGLFVHTDRARDLRAVFALELASQVVEFAWYLYVVAAYGRVVTWMRYLDWVVSTPVMLVSFVLFFLHRAGAPADDLWRSARLYLVLSLNHLMLAAGFAGEVGALRLPLALGLGGVAFVGSFAAVATYVSDDALSLALYGVVFAVWAGYGIAAAFPYVPKNVAYNALDVVAKNCYGLFLTAYALA